MRYFGWFLCLQSSSMFKWTIHATHILMFTIVWWLMHSLFHESAKIASWISISHILSLSRLSFNLHDLCNLLYSVTANFIVSYRHVIWPQETPNFRGRSHHQSHLTKKEIIQSMVSVIYSWVKWIIFLCLMLNPP